MDTLAQIQFFFGSFLFSLLLYLFWNWVEDLPGWDPAEGLSSSVCAFRFVIIHEIHDEIWDVVEVRREDHLLGIKRLIPGASAILLNHRLRFEKVRSHLQLDQPHFTLRK